jgi:hypothetical protein
MAPNCQPHNLAAEYHGQAQQTPSMTVIHLVANSCILFLFLKYLLNLSLLSFFVVMKGLLPFFSGITEFIIVLNGEWH